MVNACWVIANAIQALVAMIVAKVSGFSIFSHAPATSNKTKKNPLGNAIFAALFRSLCETICKLKRKITAKKDLINVLISLRKTQKESEGDFRALSHSYMVCVCVTSKVHKSKMFNEPRIMHMKDFLRMYVSVRLIRKHKMPNVIYERCMPMYNASQCK